MGLKVIGKIVGLDTYKVKPKEGQTFTEFESTTLYIADGTGRPLEVKTTKNGRKVGEQVEISVYLDTFKSKYGSPGVNLREVKNQ